MMNNRVDVSKMRSPKEALRIIIRKSKERFSTDRIEATNRFNVSKNINMREPPTSQKNDMIIFISKERRAKGDTRFDEVRRVGIRIMRTFKATKPNRNTAACQYARKREE